MSDEKAKVNLHKPKPKPKPKRRRLRALLLSLLIFFCGMIVGGGLVTGIFGHFIKFNKYPERMVNHIVKKMDRRLDLDDQQNARIRLIIERRYDNLRKIRKEIAPQFQAEYVASYREISQVLNPEQREKWDKWIKKFSKKWGRHLPFHPPMEAFSPEEKPTD